MMRNFSRAALAALALTVSTSALAQAAAPAAPADSAVVPPLDYQTRTLPNGLRVYSIRDPNSANVSVQVWVPGVWVVERRGYGHSHRRYVDGHYEYRTQRVWVSADRRHDNRHDRWDNRHDRRDDRRDRR